MANLVTATLPRTYTWRPSDDAPELSYGPGTVQIPVALAEKLKAKRHIEDFADYSGDAPQSYTPAERLLPSQELAPDFPAREYLFLAGHTTYSHVVELSRDQLLAIPGIGVAKADAILEAIGKAAERLPKVEDLAQPVTIGDKAEPEPTRRAGRPTATANEEDDGARSSTN